MTTSDDFIVVNSKELAGRLAQQEFEKEFHGKYKFHEIYEQVDETEQFYMKMEFQSILEHMEEEWQDMLQTFDITNSVV